MKTRASDVVYGPWGPQTVGGRIVHEVPDEPVATGILGPDGRPIYRWPWRNAIGFDLGWDDEADE